MEMTGKRLYRRNTGASLYISAAMLLVAAICAFGINAFLRVSVIDVRGESRYLQEDIIRAAEIGSGDNLMLINTGDMAARISGRMPYIGGVSVTRRLPDTVIIEVSESRPLASVRSADGDWVIESGGRLLERAGARSDGLIEVKGLTPVEPMVGEILSVKEFGDDQLGYLIDILKEIEATGIEKGVKSIDMSNISNVTLSYDERFSVILGGPTDLQGKLQTLIKAVEELPEDASGRIKLSAPGKAHFYTF